MILRAFGVQVLLYGVMEKKMETIIFGFYMVPNGPEWVVLQGMEGSKWGFFADLDLHPKS